MWQNEGYYGVQFTLPYLVPLTMRFIRVTMFS